MLVNLRATVRGALDVVVPPLELERIRLRVAQRVLARKHRSIRSMRGAAALVALVALLAAGHGPHASHDAAIAALPVPAPAPLAT